MTMDDAKANMQAIALATVRVKVHQAKAEKRLAEIKAATLEKVTEDLALIDTLKEALGAYIGAHKDEFQKPRTVKTEFGEFGLRTVTELLMKDKEAVLQALMEAGYQDCVETVHSPVKDAIRKRLEAGEVIPGAVINSGDTVVCRVNSDLVSCALKEVEA
jgi:phage host-nuclease inhibitor protein Gam